MVKFTHCTKLAKKVKVHLFVHSFIQQYLFKNVPCDGNHARLRCGGTKMIRHSPFPTELTA